MTDRAKTLARLPPPGPGVVRRRLASAVGAAAAWVARVGALPVLALALVIAILGAAAVGSVPIDPLKVAGILLDQIGVFHVPHTWSYADQVILLDIRLPRVLGAALVGAALAASGTLFQALLRNPLADPLLLGTSSGAALGATIAFLLPAALFGIGFGLVAVLAFGGALAAVALVYLLATRRGQTPLVTLLLAGVAVGALLAACQTLLIILNDRLALHIVSLFLWLAGGVTVDDWGQLGVVALLIVLGVAGAIALAPTLDAFALGEEMAGYLGVQVERRKLLVVGTAALLVAAAVSISGLVGFVGLVAPHACRLLLGPRHRLLVPASALAGATFVVIADLLARVLAAPSELPLGVITSLVGGPFFLYLLRQAGQQYRW
ncbi:MAG TPA: iron ABC transporter permease [Ktedonobacterales bacterium]|jgi:iron complex transport system permease protein